MLELIFVIIILGIVASIGSEIIARVYGSYIMQRAHHRASVKTELAALQIANRLANMIPGTQMRIRKSDNGYESLETSFTGTGDKYKGVKWVGVAVDSFRSAQKPGWSGFCDVNASLSIKPKISTPGSDIPFAATVMVNLGADFTSFLPRIYFPQDPNGYEVGYDGIAETLVIGGATTPPSVIQEHYKIAWTSYALVVENNSEGGKDLNLYYNFKPSTTEPFSNGVKSTLMHNVSTFRVKSEGGTMRFKLCKHEHITSDVNVTVCKEKAVF